MNINWVIANNAVLDPTIKIETLKNVGSFWGGWQTFRGFATDNVICYDNAKALDLINKGFNLMCNFYVNQSAFTDTPPPNIKIFGGSFEHDVDSRDEIVALHLCNATADIGLLYGFDWSSDGLDKQGPHYRGLIVELIKSSDVQWVLVDHTYSLDSNLSILENITQDSLTNIVKFTS
jgi:hypothetical protein